MTSIVHRGRAIRALALSALLLIASGAGVQAADRPFELDLGGLRFDPLTEFPDLPSSGQHAGDAGGNFRLIQFEGPIRREWLQAVRGLGVDVVQYIHPFTYVVWADRAQLDTVSRAAGVRWTGELAVEFRVLPHQRGRDSTVVPTMALVSRHVEESSVRRDMELAGAVVHRVTPVTSHTSVVFLEVPGDRYLDLGRIPAVYTVQYIPPETGPRGEMSNQSIVGNYGPPPGNALFPGYVDWLDTTGYDGSGVIVGIVDGGIRTTHQDLADRIVSCVPSGDTPSSCTTANDGHGTHVAGAVAGTGATGITDSAGFLRGQGVAPGANLVQQRYVPFIGGGPGNMAPDGMLKIYRESALSGALLTNNSWGPTGTPQGYDIPTQQVDIITRDADPDTPGHQPVLPVWSIMNGGGDSGGACAPSSLGSPDEAKNLFAVGSTRMQPSVGQQYPNIFDVSPNSAHGPACDGRIVPHVVSPGCNTDSTSSNSDTAYGLLCGTSMASPVVSGAVSIFIERYRDLYGADPSPALIKAAFTAAAMDLQGFLNADSGVMGHPPDRFQGWGRIDLDAVANPPDQVVFFDQEVVFTETAESWSTSLTPDDPDKPVRLMLMWTDAPGHGLGGTTPAWVNDLDLMVDAGTDVYLGNQIGPDGFSQTGGDPDERNNMEGVFLRPDQHGGGTFEITVLAANLAGDALDPYDTESPDLSQDFALVCINCVGEGGIGGLTFDPTSLDFGDVQVGSTSPGQAATLTNTGDVEATGLTFGDPGNGFAADTGDCGTALQPEESCEVSVTFTPSEAGMAAAVLEVSGDGGASADLDLAGNGVTESTDAACVWDTTLGDPGGPLNALGLWNDTLYVGGSAGSDFNGVTAGVAAVDLNLGTTTSLGSTELVDGFVGALVPFDDGNGERQYIIGAFNGIRFDGNELPDSRGVVAWDGSETVTLEGSPFAEPLVFAQTGTVFGDRLVIGGAGGVIDPPQRPVLTLWDGSEWTTFREEFDGLVAPVVLTVEELQGDLYFGGRFASIEYPAGNVVESLNIMGFDGEGFFSVGGGLKRSTSPISQVLALETFDDGSGPALYIGGRFDSSVDDVPMFAVAKWDGSQLSAVGNGFPMPNEVRGFEVYDDGGGPVLYAVGNFTADTMGQPMARIAKLQDGEWVEVAGGAGENPNRALTLPDGSLAFAGNFTAVGGDSGTPGSGPSSGFAQLMCLADLTISPSGHDFGTIDADSTASVLFTLTNQTDAPIAIGQVATGGDPEFAVGDTDGCSDTVLAAEASCQVEMVFDPAGAEGSFGGSLSVSSEANPVLALLTGSAEAGLPESSFTAAALEVDSSAIVSDGNGVLEPGESVEVAPAWRNDGTGAGSLSGAASDFTGPAGAVYSLVSDDADYGTLEPGQTASCQETEVCYLMGVSNPPVRPAPHWEATFEETLSDDTVKTWTLHIGDSFADVPTTNLFYPSIETLLHHGITGGCTGTEYCPTASNTRDQMPVFVLRAVEGMDYQPPACVEGAEVFHDVSAGNVFCPWIEELANRDVVSGCGGGNYCPNAPVTRAQMAIFLLRSLEGSDYEPPACTGQFVDVPCPSLFADWIEDLFAREITGGCSGEPMHYCPANAVNREQMAAFIGKAFELTLYGP